MSCLRDNPLVVVRMQIVQSVGKLPLLSFFEVVFQKWKWLCSTFANGADYAMIIDSW
jgi:hypothetical protein